jgi:hypothetical protein
MRNDVFIEEVLRKCSAFKSATIWPPEPHLNPRAWLNNFDDDDKYIAAVLLDKFNFYNETLTNHLLISAYNSIADGLPKGPQAPSAHALQQALNSALFTLVEGEQPNPTDSGYNFCRRARQVLKVPEEYICSPEAALRHALQGNTVVFLDDFIGSGDQFLKTWNRQYPSVSNHSFATAQQTNNFIAIYIALVSTSYGLGEIHKHAPNVAVCVTHTLDDQSTFKGIKPAELQPKIANLLIKYSPRLQPKESYMQYPAWKAYGYKERGLLFGFSHSIPDATLPIFWAPGNQNWEPLIERV